jgi:sugar lactone lactonase YvrE
MDDKEKRKTGAFFCFENGKLRRTKLDQVAITNGPAVSPDGRLLYFVDTQEGTIGCADIAADGSLGDPRPFARIDSSDGHPDGPTIDSEGCLWIGLYGGWAAHRFSPSGEVIDRVRFPVANVTKLAFGGDGLRTAYATSARQLLSRDEIATQPEIGDLFEFPVEVAGVPCPSVRL